MTTSPGLQAVHRLLVAVEADELAVVGHVDLVVELRLERCRSWLSSRSSKTSAMATSLIGPLLVDSALPAAPVPRPPQPTRATWIVLSSPAWTLRDGDAGQRRGRGRDPAGVLEEVATRRPTLRFGHGEAPSAGESGVRAIPRRSRGQGGHHGSTRKSELWRGVETGSRQRAGRDVDFSRVRARPPTRWAGLPSAYQTHHVPQVGDYVIVRLPPGPASSLCQDRSKSAPRRSGVPYPAVLKS